MFMFVGQHIEVNVSNLLQVTGKVKVFVESLSSF